MNNDLEVEVGNCYTIEQNGKHYGLILVLHEEKYKEYSVAFLEKISEEPLTKADFIQGNVLYDVVKFAGGAEGLPTGLFYEEYKATFQKEFSFVGKLDINPLRVEIIGGGHFGEGMVSLDHFFSKTHPMFDIITRTVKPVSYYTSFDE